MWGNDGVLSTQGIIATAIVIFTENLQQKQLSDLASHTSHCCFFIGVLFTLWGGNRRGGRRHPNVLYRAGCGRNHGEDPPISPQILLPLHAYTCSWCGVCHISILSLITLGKVRSLKDPQRKLLFRYNFHRYYHCHHSCHHHHSLRLPGESGVMNKVVARSATVRTLWSFPLPLGEDGGDDPNV